MKYQIQMQKYEFNVEMTCSGCSAAVERVLGRLQGKWCINAYNGVLHEALAQLPGASQKIWASILNDQINKSCPNRESGKLKVYCGHMTFNTKNNPFSH